MNTSHLFYLFLCSAVIAALYIVCRFASAELSRSGAVREKDSIQIYAEADSLEYYLRVALAASESDHMTIVVNIPRHDGRKQEMKAIVRMMRRRHKNIFYRIT